MLFSCGKLGDEWSEDQEVTEELEALTCLIYGFAWEKSVNTVRNIILSKVVGEKASSQSNLKWISPGFYIADSFALQFARVKYGLVHYKYAHKTIFFRHNFY